MVQPLNPALEQGDLVPIRVREVAQQGAQRVGLGPEGVDLGQHGNLLSVVKKMGDPPGIPHCVLRLLGPSC
jgi:hypothetical protein